MEQTDIIKLKIDIEKLENEAKELENEICRLNHDLNSKKVIIKHFKDIVKDAEYSLRNRTDKKSVKEILEELVNEENGYANLLNKLYEMRKIKYTEEDQKDINEAVMYLEHKFAEKLE